PVSDIIRVTPIPSGPVPGGPACQPHILMKTDALFSNLFSNRPETFFELIGSSPAEAKTYRLEALEIKQTSYRLDGVFRPDDAERPIYFVEVVFQGQENFYERFCAKILDYFDQKHETRRWYAWALFASRSLDPGIPLQIEHAIKEGVLKRYYLEDLRQQNDLPLGLELLRLIVTPERESESEARRVLRRAREEAGAQQKEMIESVETVLVYKFPQLGRKELERMFDLAAFRDTAVYREAFTEGEAEGEKKGKREGEKKGKREGKLDAVPFLLELGASEEQIAVNLSLNVEEVRAAALAPSKKPSSRKPRSRRRRQPGE
ncbi:MAG TPA: Rpn family recombination-promoting nuclease/putative transposase, partial [Armatimonadota bacterium]|nr:Rpn family recombination-promoting nuclease/putative transposase [Armatimonadota bacterium]